jgi:hypothetical protein
MVVEDAIEQGRLREEQKKRKQGKADGKMAKDAVQSVQDEPIQVIVFGMQGRCHGVQEQGEFQHQGIGQQDQDIYGAFLSEDTDHG